MFDGNPFPGLRPFQFDENFLFFGREEQVSQLLKRLGNTRFLAVVGASGSGKSSLVRAGLLPELHGGTMTSTSIAWETVIMRPGGDPLSNLADSLVESGLFGDENEENVFQTHATLSRSGLGLIEAYRQSDIEEGANMLLLVDQFEEIFRFRQSGSKASQEAAHFIQLLLETTRQSEVPIFIILTMRSDFLGDCAEFKGLAEAVNEGEYLIPRLNRKQRARAIEGPVKVGGGEISPRLKQQLLNDIGDDPDQLPILQHALMRMWDYWEPNSGKLHPMDLEHYDAIGRMAEALSRHADEVYQALPDDQHRLLCMKLFKAITEKQADGRGIRRPLPFGEIDEITGHEPEKMLTVIDAYRPTGRTFIMPSETVKINSHVIIDISHESLMRVWVRLKEWVNEEADSARIYTRLCETAELHSIGEAGFYRDPDLKIALSWREKNKPNENWGARINDSFELAMRFLDVSKQNFETEQRAKEEARKRELEQARAIAEAEKERADIQKRSAKRNKIFALVLFVLAGLATFSAYQATKAEKRAINSEKKAKIAFSNSQLIEAERMVDADSPHNAISLLTKAYEENSDYDVLLNRAYSMADTQSIAQYNGEIFDFDSHIILDPHGFIYEPNLHTVGLIHKEKGESFASVFDLKQEKELLRTPMLDLAESINYSSDGGYVAIACKLNNGNWDGALVYNVKTGEEVLRIETTPSPVLFATISNDLKDFVVGTSNGEVFHMDATRTISKILDVEGDVWEVRLHPRKRIVAIVESKNRSNFSFHFRNLETNETKTLYSSPEEKVCYWNQCRFSPSGKYLALHGGGDQIGVLKIYDGDTGEEFFSSEKDHEQSIFDAVFSLDETLVITTSRDRTLKVWNLITRSEYGQSMKHNAETWRGGFSPDQSKYAAVTSSADVAIWDVESRKLTHSYLPHDKPVIMSAFSRDGRYLYSGSTDGKIHKWDISSNNRLPILLTHDKRLLDVVVDSKSGLVATSAEDGLIKLWDPKTLSLVRTTVVESDPINDGNVWSMLLNNDSTLLASFINKNPWRSLKFKLWSWPDMTLVGEVELPENSSATAFSPNNNLFAFANKQDFSLFLYNSDPVGEVGLNTNHGGEVFAIKFSSNGQFVATGCLDGYARVFLSEDFSQVGESLPFGFSYGAEIDFSKDNQLLLARSTLGRDSNNVVIWDIPTSRELFRLKHQSGIMNHLFSSDGKTVFTCSKDNTVKMWSLKDGSLLGVFNHSQRPVAMGELPSNIGSLFTLDEVGSSRIWNINTEQIIDGPFKGLPGEGWLMKTKAMPLSSAFVSSYGNDSLAYWYSPISEYIAGNDNDALVPFLECYVGGKVDTDNTFNLIDRDFVFDQKFLNSYADVSGEDNNRWLNWKFGSNQSLFNTPSGKFLKNDIVSFLLQQDTVRSINQALIINPSDKKIMGALSQKYLKLSVEAERMPTTGLGNSSNKSKQQLKTFFNARSKWYSRQAVEAANVIN